MHISDSNSVVFRSEYVLPAFVGKTGKRVPLFQQQALREKSKQWDLNPLTGEIYAYSVGNGPAVICLPYVSWIHIARQYDDFDGFDFIPSKDVKEYDINGKKVRLPVWVKCSVKLNQNRDVEFGIFSEEISAREFSTSSSPREFLKNKALVGAIRLAFGVTGFCTPEEGRFLFESNQKEKQKTSILRKVTVCLFG